MEILSNKYRYDGNVKVHSAYVGVANGHRTITAIKAVNKNADRLDTSRAYGVGIPRGQGGRIGTLILGGMETTLDEIHYILEGVKEKKFVPVNKPKDIAQMCRELIERRNDRIKYLRKNPSEAPKRRRAPTLYLPAKYQPTTLQGEGYKIASKVK